MGDAADDAHRKAMEEQENPIIDVDLEEEPDDGFGPQVRTAELVIHEERQLPQPATVLPTPKEWEATLAVARQIAMTEFVPESYRGKPESVVAAILTGREMGIGPMQSMRQIHMIDGRPAFSADLMMAKMRQGGLMVLESSVDESRAYIKARRKDTGEEAEVEWTTEDANKANLLGKRNWKTYPADMLWARCVGRLARRLGSDLLGGLVYSKEEMEDWDDGGGYGVGDGYGASTQKPFDPEKDLLPGAIQGKEAPKQLAAALERIDPTIEWADLLATVVLEKWNKVSWRELEGGDQSDFWRRLSNAVQWIENKDGDGDFPPADTDTIIKGFAYAFSGAQVANIPYKEALADEDDIPWPEGDDPKAATTYERPDE